MAEIKQTTNVVNVVGVLVKNGLECKVNSKGADCISGSLVLRTNDGSEHQIDYYANKLTKEGKESGLYKGLVTIMEQAVDLSHLYSYFLILFVSIVISLTMAYPAFTTTILDDFLNWWLFPFLFILVYFIGFNVWICYS